MLNETRKDSHVHFHANETFGRMELREKSVGEPYGLGLVTVAVAFTVDVMLV